MTAVVPPRMAGLPRDHRGFVVPAFVAWIDGKPDFRVFDRSFLLRAVKQDLCWLCGQKLGTFKCYVIGPMCAVNRTTSEPPCHRDCAVYALMVCPFLTQPRMRRNEKNLPDGHVEAAGVGLKRNPGMSVLWIQRKPARWYRVSAEPFGTPPHGGSSGGVNAGRLFKLGDPVETQWWMEGRLATRYEAIAALERGAPAIRDIAIAEGHGAIDAFEGMYARAQTYLPPPP